MKLIRENSSGYHLTRKVDEKLERDPVHRVVAVAAQLERLGRVDVGAELLARAEVDVLRPGKDIGMI